MSETQWRKDGFGDDARALYLGNLFVGSVYKSTGQYHHGEWRGWFMDDDEGNETGWFETADEARKSVEEALKAALA